MWHLVMPSGTRTMYKEQFVRARYILKGLSEGRAMPPRFPEHVFGERAPLPVSIGMASLLGARAARLRHGVTRADRARASLRPGTREHPIRYDYFAYLLRPILEVRACLHAAAACAAP